MNEFEAILLALSLGVIVGAVVTEYRSSFTAIVGVIPIILGIILYKLKEK